MLAAIAKICTSIPEQAVEVLPGKLVVDIKPAGINKGDAVYALMQHVPFVGRCPVFIGDDITDLPVFGIIPAFGGQAYSVGGIAAEVNGHFATPEAVRDWLSQIAAGDLGSAE